MIERTLTELSKLSSLCFPRISSIWMNLVVMFSKDETLQVYCELIVGNSSFLKSHVILIDDSVAQNDIVSNMRNV